MGESHKKSYWTQVFTQSTWERFLDAGARITGFRPRRWRFIEQELKPGDILLCYVSGHGKWIGVLEVTSEPYFDTKRIWKEDTFPCRVDVKLIASLPFEKGVAVDDLRTKLRKLRGKKKWSLYFINSPSRWDAEDGRLIETEIRKSASSM